MRRTISIAVTALLLAACGRPAARLQHARDLALAGHHKTALLEARAILLTLRDEQGEKVDAVRRGALKLAGDLCAVYLDDPRCALWPSEDSGTIVARAGCPSAGQADGDGVQEIPRQPPDR